MPRKPEIDRPVQLVLKLPTSWYTRVKLLLFSPLEGRVPQGKYQEFFIERLKDYFETESLDLAPYIPGCSSDVHVIRGTPAALNALRIRLELEVT